MTSIQSRLCLPVLLLLLLAGCQHAAPKFLRKTTELGQFPQPAPIQRLARERLEQASTTSDYIAAPSAQWKLQGHSPVIVEGDMAVVPKLGPKLFIDIPVQFDGSDYAYLDLEVRADAGTRVGLTWIGARQKEFALAPQLAKPLMPDGEFHQYRLPLRTFSEPRFVGNIHVLRLWPSDVAANVAVRALKFSAEAQTPPTVIISNQVCETVFGTQPPWRVTVPPRGVFSTWMGLLPAAKSDGARFLVEIAREGESPKQVVNQWLLPYSPRQQKDWFPVQVDLAEYAGQTIDLSLRAEFVKGKDEDYPMWGAPVVYSRQEAPVPRVILISWDTLRADHLEPYGYERSTSPNLLRFAEDAVVFEQAYTPESWTLTAHATMMTGLHPLRHGVTAATNLPGSVDTLGELLSNHGYLTGGFTGHSTWLEPWRGSGHGFDIYNMPTPRSRGFRSMFRTQAFMLDWLQANAEVPLFLFYHNYDTHSKPLDSPYELTYEVQEGDYVERFINEFNPQPTMQRPDIPRMQGRAFIENHNQGQLAATEEETQFLIAQYDDTIRIVDAKLGAFFDWLRAHDMYDNSLIVFTSDHGEGFNEHGKLDHVEMYENCAHVPLMVKFPGNAHAGERVATLTRLEDILPTVCAVAGVQTPPGIDGQNLLPLLEGEPSKHEQVYGHRIDARTVREGDWKYVIQTRPEQEELFNLEQDPEEQENLIGQQPELEADLKAKVETFFETKAGGWKLVFVAGKKNTNVSLKAHMDSPLVLSKMINPDAWIGHNSDSEEEGADASRFVAELQLRPQDTDQVVLQTEAADSKLTLLLETPVAIEVVMGDQVLPASRSHRLDLSSGAPELAATPEPTQGETPRVYISFSNPETDVEAARELSVEEIKSLEALGYVGN